MLSCPHCGGSVLTLRVHEEYAHERMVDGTTGVLLGTYDDVTRHRAHRLMFVDTTYQELRCNGCGAIAQVTVDDAADAKVVITPEHIAHLHIDDAVDDRGEEPRIG